METQVAGVAAHHEPFEKHSLASTISLVAYRSISIVQLIPNDEPNYLECLLCSEPRGHTGVDNDTNIPFILSIQAKVLLFIIILWLKLIHFTYLHTFIRSTVTFFVPNC